VGPAPRLRRWRWRPGSGPGTLHAGPGKDPPPRASQWTTTCLENARCWRLRGPCAQSARWR
jgi:hypothetical protein